MSDITKKSPRSIEEIIEVTPQISESSCLLRQQRMVDQKVDSAMRSCDCCELVLPAVQLQGFPASLLCLARICRIMLIFFIFFCVTGLLVGYALEGSMTLLEEIDSKRELAAPNLALCPQPWGDSFTAEKLAISDAHVLEIPGGKKQQQVKWELDQCPAMEGRLDKCRCIDLSQNLLHMHGKRGDIDYLEYVSLTMSGLANEGGSPQIAFGFFMDGLPPQQWTYTEVGHITEGDLRHEEVAEGKTEFSDGNAVPRFTFRKTGDTPAPAGQTIFVFGYDKYLAYVLSSFASKFSFFAIMTLVITCCAAINNFGLFDIMFPEKSETAELEPNICLRCIFQPCCSCCRPVDDAEEQDPLLKP